MATVNNTLRAHLDTPFDFINPVNDKEKLLSKEAIIAAVALPLIALIGTLILSVNTIGIGAGLVLGFTASLLTFYTTTGVAKIIHLYHLYKQGLSEYREKYDYSTEKILENRPNTKALPPLPNAPEYGVQMGLPNFNDEFSNVCWFNVVLWHLANNAHNDEMLTKELPNSAKDADQAMQWMLYQAIKEMRNSKSYKMIPKEMYRKLIAATKKFMAGQDNSYIIGVDPRCSFELLQHLGNRFDFPLQSQTKNLENFPELTRFYSSKVKGRTKNPSPTSLNFYEIDLNLDDVLHECWTKKSSPVDIQKLMEITEEIDVKPDNESENQSFDSVKLLTRIPNNFDIYFNRVVQTGIKSLKTTRPLLLNLDPEKGVTLSLPEYTITYQNIDGTLQASPERASECLLKVKGAIHHSGGHYTYFKHIPDKNQGRRTCRWIMYNDLKKPCNLTYLTDEEALNQIPTGSLFTTSLIERNPVPNPPSFEIETVAPPEVPSPNSSAPTTHHEEPEPESPTNTQTIFRKPTISTQTYDDFGQNVGHSKKNKHNLDYLDLATNQNLADIQTTSLPSPKNKEPDPKSPTNTHTNPSLSKKEGGSLI